MEVIATLNPSDEIFRKDYVAPPTRKRLRDIETIVLPNELFDGMPKSTSKVKSRRLKVMSEAFAAEKASRLKDMQKSIYEEIVSHEERLDHYKQMMKPMPMMPKRIFQEEVKGDAQPRIMQPQSQVSQINNIFHSSDKGTTSKNMSAGTPHVKEFLIPNTPSTDESVKNSGTPQKFQSPGTAIRDLTQRMMDTNMKTPPKDGNASSHGQNNYKKK